MKILGIVAKWIFILCLPTLLISGSLAWGFNSAWLYEYGFKKYDVSRVTGISEADLNKSAQGLINYFNSSDEYVHITVTQYGQQVELLNQDEQFHFKDVKQLIWLDYRVGIITLVFVLGYILVSLFWRRGKYWRPLSRSVIWGSGLTIFLILVVGIASMLDFDQLFLEFHYLVFTNSYWSAEGNMLLLFPGGFWYDAALICIGFMAGLAVILGGSAIAYLRITRSKPLPFPEELLES